MQDHRDLEAHRTDRFAHNESWGEQRKPYIDGRFEEQETMINRLRSDVELLKAFKEQAKGGFFTLSALLGGGLLVVVAHLLGVPV